MALPGKLYRDGNTLKIENFSGTPRIFIVEQFGFHNYHNDDIFRWIDVLTDNGVNGMRVFGIWPFGRGNEEEPFVKTANGYDLNRFNEPYFEYLQRWVTYANDKGVVVLFELFDSCGFWAAEYAPYNPFYSLVGSSHLKFSDLSNTHLVNIQKRYIQKVVETVSPNLNVIFGIMNEFKGDKRWHYVMSRYVKSLAPNHLVAGSEEDSEAAADPNADIWFVHTGKYKFSTRTSNVPADMREMRRRTGPDKILGFSTDGFGSRTEPENPTDMGNLARDVVRANLQLFGFLDHQAYDMRGGAIIEQLNVETYQAIVSIFLPTPQPKPSPRFRFDEDTFKSLNKKDVADNVIRKLQRLAGEEYFTEEDLLRAVESTIGSRQTTRYRDLIVKYTTIGRPPFGFLDIFNTAYLPATHKGAFVERGGKAIRATTTQGFLCYGQYQQGYPMIPLKAYFSILIDNNTADDRNILILDVYDHHSDRVLGNEVITRKDFEKANEFCLFEFDFIPPGADANMEFRIYYMGWSYVLADKIAVVDPAEVTVQTAADIPEPPSVVIPTKETPESGETLDPTIIDPDYCSGNDLICLPAMTEELVRKNGGASRGGQFLGSGQFKPTPTGGLVFTKTIDTSRKFCFEFDIEGNIPNWQLGEHDGGKVCLFTLKELGGSYRLWFQRMRGDYRGGGRFRMMLEDRPNGQSFLITIGDLSGEYSMANWGDEPHHFEILVHGNSTQLKIDQFTSRPAWTSYPISGTRQLQVVIGNRHTEQMGLGNGALTRFKRARLYYV
jgi:hypothetical protein